MSYINWKVEDIAINSEYPYGVPSIDANLTGLIENYGAFNSRSMKEIAQEIEDDLNRSYCLEKIKLDNKNISKQMQAFMYGNFMHEPEITNVKFNPPATIVFWSDKTKTVVKAQDDEPFDPEKGLAMAMVKKYLGNKGSYFNEISKWTQKYYEYDAPAVEIKLCTDSSPLADVAEALRKAFAKPSREETFVPQPIIIDTGADLIDIVHEINDIIERKGYATVQDYYDLVGYDYHENCSRHGWKKDPTFTVTIDRYGYCLKLSEAKLLEGVD